MATSLTKEDKRWRAQNDARTLAEAETILGDKNRRSAAASEAKKMAKEVVKQVKTLNKIAKKSKKR